MEPSDAVHEVVGPPAGGRLDLTPLYDLTYLRVKSHCRVMVRWSCRVNGGNCIFLRDYIGAG